MKRLVETETKDELEKYLDKQIVFLCSNYFYTGKLVGFNDDFFTIKDPAIIYETGSWSNKEWKDCQKMNEDEISVMKHSIECFFITTKTPY